MQLCHYLSFTRGHMQRFGSDERGCFEGAEAGEAAGEWEAADGAEMGVSGRPSSRVSG
jgi:hypothetical protein